MEQSMRPVVQSVQWVYGAINWRRVTALAPLLVAALLLLFRLDQPTWGSGPTPTYSYDESYTAFAAGRMAQGDFTVLRPNARRIEYLALGAADLTPASRGEWSHPPAAELLIAASIRLFGWSAVAARIPAVLAGLITLYAMRAWCARRHRLIAPFLLLMDGVFFVFARTAMPHIFVAAGVAAGVACLRVGLGASLSRGSRWVGFAGFALSGLGFGVACGARWTALPIALCAFLAAATWSLRLLRKRSSARSTRAHRAWALRGLVGIMLAFAMMVATYALAWLPAWTAGIDLVALHRAMWHFHTHLPAHSGASSPVWTWPWLRAPIVFSLSATGSTWSMTAAAGNPLVWWAIVPATLALARRARSSRFQDILPLGATLGAVLPWLLVSRFGYFYYLLPALPFVLPVWCRALDFAARTCFTRARPPKFVWAYTTVAMLFFVASYPILSAIPLAPRAMAFERALQGLPGR